MTEDMLVVRNASLPESDGQTTLTIREGRIESIGSGGTGAGTVIDAEGGLLAPTFVDPHTHLDKAMVLDRLEGGTGDLDAAVDAMRSQKEEYTIEDVKERAERAIDLHLDHGCTRIRTHVDVDRVGGLTGLEGVLAARDAYADSMDIEIVAFPQEALFTEDGSVDLLEQALDNGADVVGGIPAFEASEQDMHRHIDILLELAADRDLPVDMHIDENQDPDSRTLEYLARRTDELGLDDGRVTASHACALGTYPDEYAEQVIGMVAEADINVVTNPGSNLLLQGRESPYPRSRGLTRVGQLMDAGVTVAAGQDNMQDRFYPYGEGNMLEVGRLLSHAAHMDSAQAQEAVLEMVTSGADTVLGRDREGIEPGGSGSFNVFGPEVSSITDALRSSPCPRYTVQDGEILQR